MLCSATTALLAGGSLAGGKRGREPSVTHRVPGRFGAPAARGLSGSNGEEGGREDGWQPEPVLCSHTRSVLTFLPGQTAAGRGLSRPAARAAPRTPPNPNPCCQPSQEQQVSPALALIQYKSSATPGLRIRRKQLKNNCHRPLSWDWGLLRLSGNWKCLEPVGGLEGWEGRSPLIAEVAAYSKADPQGQAGACWAAPAGGILASACKGCNGS